MRLFLAIDLPAEARADLYSQLAPLRIKYPGYSWVPPEKFHITVHFFGETSKDREISARLKDLFYDIPSFMMYPLKLDTFVKSKILLHLTFRREKTLETIAQRIQEDLNLPKSKFIPHLTISRSALSSKQQYFALKNVIEKLNIDIEFRVEKLILFQTIFEGKKPVYKKVEEFKLL